MNKNEFLKIISEGLNDFPPEELNEIISDYEGHFRDALSDGKTEEEIINNLGDAFVIVNRYRSGYVQSVPRYKNSNTNDPNNGNTNNSYNTVPLKGTSSNSNTVNTLLKIAIAIVALILIGPLGIAGGASLFALAVTLVVIPFAVSLSGIALLLGKSGLSLFGFAVPAFLADFPTSVIALVTIGSIFATILVTILSVYLIKAVIIFIRKLFNKLFNKGVN
ncbi:MAG TPA: DUF1700 domain-containing protein [Clostridium sp.]